MKFQVVFTLSLTTVCHQNLLSSCLMSSAFPFSQSLVFSHSLLIPLFLAQFCLIYHRSGLEVELLRTGEPETVLSPKSHCLRCAGPRTTTLPFRFCSPSSAVFASFLLPKMWAPPTPSRQCSQQSIPSFCCMQWAKPSTWISQTSAFGAPNPGLSSWLGP